MKTALISDIHSNLEALTEALKYIESDKEINKIVCLGDIVGYGADPAACLDIVTEKASITVIGNHDSAVARLTDIEYFNFVAREAIHWTRNNITEEHAAFLSSLPYEAKEDNILYTHSSPEAPEEWDYIFSFQDAQFQINSFPESICFVGHSHVPGIYGRTMQNPHEHGEVKLDPDEKYIINIGSVGQPRDGNPRLSFAVLDLNEYSIEIIRLEYDIETARGKILEFGLPKYLADRILAGR